MRDIGYQKRVIAVLDAYLDELCLQKRRATQIEEVALTKPELSIEIPDFTLDTWKTMQGDSWQGPKLPPSRRDTPYSTRIDGLNRPVPNITFKVPTGGGKTLLAVYALSHIFNTYLSSNHGFVLWIVPNEAIYSQTKRQLLNRDHPYRQLLDQMAAGKVKILEKTSCLDRRDIESHLCVMLLMLQSANRDIKQSLRFFRDQGNIHGFFPSESECEAHLALLKLIPNLDVYPDDMAPIIKDSPGNALRMVRPVIILDEGHKAVSELARETLYGFNPCFMLELTATPKDINVKGQAPIYANVLVEILGKDLDDEGMIKMPINVTVKGGNDWRNCLRSSIQMLAKLQHDAEEYQAESGTYLRPILLVQVERTGRDKRDGIHIHADDVKDFLLQAGFTTDEIAVKTSQVNDLKAPENQDLLSPACPVRVIVTKTALQEGWDCPFAYILCSLSASSNLIAMTQLIGRILRQPNTTKTGVSFLDECYVVCLHSETKQIVEAVKKGLEADGLADLIKRIHVADDNEEVEPVRKVYRRNEFKQTEIFLPIVLRQNDSEVRRLDYDQDILYGIDWNALDITQFAERIPFDVQVAETQMKRIHITDGTSGEFFTTEDLGRTLEEQEFDPVFATRVIADLVPNAWQAFELIQGLAMSLKKKGFTEERMGELAGYILEELRKWLIKECDRLAEQYFITEVAAERIQFRLRSDTNNWIMPDEIPTLDGNKLWRPDDSPIQKSIFAPVYELDFNSDEAEFACYLDAYAALTWWHRNVAHPESYGLQGWRRYRVYPDFIFAIKDGGITKLFVIETKGNQFEGNLDTEYKKKILDLLTREFSVEPKQKIGDFEVVVDEQTTLKCSLVLINEWKIRLHTDILSPSTS